MSVTAPTSEIGYVVTPTYTGLPTDDFETTPELRWPQSIYVYDQMRRTDAQVGSVLRAVTETLLRTPWRIDPAGARARVTKFVADDLGLPIVGKNPTPPPRLKDRFSWASHLREALLMLPFGHSYFEQQYRITDDGKAAHLRKLSYRPSKTIERIDVASDGGLISIQQYWTTTNTDPKPIPVDHLVAYIHAKEGGNWLGTSILRNCYKNWLLKDRLLRVQAQTIERNGMGIPLYTAAETETNLTAGLNMATSWRAGEAAGSAVPFGATLKLVGVEGTLPDAMPAIEYHDSQIARAVLAHFLNLGQQTGSWALGTTFADFFTMSLQTLAEQIRDTATQHVVEDLVDINFGEEEPAPRLVFDEIGSRQAATAAAIKTLVDAGVLHPDEVLEESTRQQYGLPPADPSTATPPPGAPTATPPAPTQMGDTSPAVNGDPKAVAATAAATGGTDSETDQDVDALFAAVGELEVWAAAFDPADYVQADAAFENKHKRGRGGKFATMADRLGGAIQNWLKTDRSKDPFEGFDREQLRRVAKTRGLTLRRGASRDEIAKALFEDLHTGATSAPKPATPKAPVKKAGTPSKLAELRDMSKLEARDALDNMTRAEVSWGPDDFEIILPAGESGKDSVHAKYNPLQARDDKGRWTDGMPEAVLTRAFQLLGGVVELAAFGGDDDGRGEYYNRAWIQVSDADGNYFQIHDDRPFGSEIGDPADLPIGYGPEFRRANDEHGGGGVIYGLERTGENEYQFLIPDGDEDENDLIERAADGGGIRITRQQFESLAGAADQARAARRFDTDNGQVDFYPTPDGKVGVRIEAQRGKEPTELSFDEKDWEKVWDAVNLVYEGFDENDPDEKAPVINEVRVRTKLGELVVMALNRGPDKDKGELGVPGTFTISPVDSDAWHLTWSAGDGEMFEHPIWGAREVVADNTGRR